MFCLMTAYWSLLVLQDMVQKGNFGLRGKGMFRDVSINDAPRQIRYSLTGHNFQDDIQRRTGCIVNTRGRYFVPGTPMYDGELPLYLHISPGCTLQVHG